MKENEIQRQILDWLKAKGFWAWRCPLSGLRLGKGGKAKNPMVGHPDIAGILPDGSGRYFAIEVKKPKGGRFSDKQVEWGRRALSNKVVYMVAKSLEDVVQALGHYAPRLSEIEMADALDSLHEGAV